MAIPEHGLATLQDIVDDLGPPWEAYRVLNRVRRWNVPVIIEGQNEPMFVDDALAVLVTSYGPLLPDQLRFQLDDAHNLAADCHKEAIENLDARGCQLPEWWHVFRAITSYWCPLYGPLPDPPDAYPVTPAGRALAVIESAREMLGVYPDEYRRLDEPDFLTASGCWPATDSGMLPEEFVKACRLLAYDGFREILRAQLDDVRCQFLGDEVSLGLDQIKPDMLLRYSRRALTFQPPQSAEFKGACIDVTDAEIFAVMAIREAWWTLEGALCPNEHVTEIGVHRHCQQAEGLLRLAESAAMRPDANRGVKTIESARQGGWQRSDNFAQEKENWRTRARDILASRTRRKPSTRELARLVAADLHPELTELEREKLIDSRRKWLRDL